MPFRHKGLAYLEDMHQKEQPEPPGFPFELVQRQRVEHLFTQIELHQQFVHSFLHDNDDKLTREHVAALGFIAFGKIIGVAMQVPRHAIRGRLPTSPVSVLPLTCLVEGGVSGLGRWSVSEPPPAIVLRKLASRIFVISLPTSA